jgi:hypothetical protein
VIPVDGLPLLVKLDFAVLLKLAAAAKNTIMEGGFEFNFGGSAGFSVSPTGDIARAATFVKSKGSTVATPQQFVALGGGGLTFGVQLKFGVGPGIRNDNLSAYVSAIATVGEEAGIAAAGQLCTTTYASLFFTSGIEATYGFPFIKRSRHTYKSPSLVLYSHIWPPHTTGNCYVALAP